MGELFNLAAEILKLAASNTLSEIQSVQGSRDKLDSLMYKVKTIQAVLLVAEKQQWHNYRVKLWLERIGDVLYDTWEFLEDVTTEYPQWKVMPGDEMSQAIQTDEILEDIQSTSTVIVGQGSIQSPMPVIIQEIPRAEDVVVNIPTETSGGVQNQTDEILEDIQSTSTVIAGQGSIQSPMPVIIQEIPRAEDVIVNIPTATSGGVQNQTDEILEDIQSPSMAIAGQGSIQSPMPAIMQEIPRAENVAVNIPTGASGGVQNQTDQIVEAIQCLSMAIAGQGNIQSPMRMIILEIPRAGDVAVNNEIETNESSGEHKKKKRIRGKKEMLKLALMATLLGSASTAFFAVNQHTYLDWLGMVFIICFNLAVALVMLGKHYQSRRMVRWGGHFTRATMVLMGVVVIAAAMLRKGGDIGTRGVQNNQELPRRLLKNLNGFKKYAKKLDAKQLSIDVLAKKSSYTLWAEK